MYQRICKHTRVCSEQGRKPYKGGLGKHDTSSN